MPCRTLRDVTTSDADADRLRALFDAHAFRVLAYASRHVDSHSAHDVVSEVFLTAWRRLDDVPADPLPWLLVVARNTIHNRTRSAARQHQLAHRLTTLGAAAATAPAAEDTVVERQAMTAALAALTSVEREALLLTAWDGLAAVDAALVAGCSPRAFEVRLHRARSRLRRTLRDGERADGARALPRPSRPQPSPLESTS